MAIFKNIDNIKSGNDNLDLRIGYLRSCREKIDNFLDSCKKDKKWMLDLRKLGKPFDDWSDYALMSCTRVISVFEVSYVKEIRFSEADTIEIIFGVESLGNNFVYMIWSQGVYYDIFNLVTAFSYFLSDDGREKVLGIKRSIYKFKFKVDISGTKMFSSGQYFNINFKYSNEYLLHKCFFTEDRIEKLTGISEMIKEFFVNYDRFAKDFVIINWSGESLEPFSIIGKIIKTKKLIEIKESSAFKQRCRFKDISLLPGIEDITLPGAKIKMTREIYSSISDLEEVKKKYDVELYN